MKKFYGQNLNIRSIIGSSAGAILGLGIACNLSTEEMMDITTKYLSTITKEDRKFKHDTKEQEFAVLAEIKSFLTSYGIFEEDLFYFIEQVLAKQSMQKAFLSVLKALNPAIYDLFQYKEGEEARIYGLLMAALMSGENIKNIAMSMLSFFAQNYNKEKASEFLSEHWHEAVTMEQFYELTGIEFTCTSVDLKNHILRFFNHKTTPDLPVSSAVQMSGSFPCAFESQKWKKEWGKYYVHYANTRKEVDLEGIHFTDGGMLANFPLKYLDNERMRPMYFSHANIQGKTVLYGFGVNFVGKPSTTEQKQLDEALDVIGKELRKCFTHDKVLILSGKIFKKFVKDKGSQIKSLIFGEAENEGHY